MSSVAGPLRGLALIAGLAGLLAPEARPHGMINPPINPGPIFGPAGPPAGGGASGAPGGSKPRVAPPSVPPTAGTGGGAAGQAKSANTSRGGSGLPKGKGKSAVTGGADDASLNGWEFWWDANKDALLQGLAERRAPVVTGPSRPRPADPPTEVLADRALVEQRIAPTLRAVLDAEREPELIDSAVLALARVTPGESADLAYDAIHRGLSNETLSVRTSATLSLGVLGSARALPLLNALMTNAPAGQRAVSEGAVPWQVRAYAAIALGLTNEPMAVDPLLEVVATSAGNQEELRAAAVLALGMMRNDRSRDALTGLLKLLDDRRLETVVRAAIPTALARLGDASLVPHLLEVFADPDTDPYVRQSLVIAFGTLADLGQPGVLATLAQSVTEPSDAATRHYAAISLARVGARCQDPALADERRDVERLLRREVMDPSHRADRGWLALATALYGREQPAAQAMLTEVLARTYEKEHDPSRRGAIALGLGLIGADDMAPRLLEDFTASGDDSFRGYAAVSLGLLRCHEAATALRRICSDQTVSDTLRQQVVRGLTLMDDPQLVPVLLDALSEARTIGVAWSLSRALGQRRDSRSVEPLLKLATDTSRSIPSRAFACVALGLVGDKADLRFNADMARDCNYLLLTATLQEIFSL